MVTESEFEIYVSTMEPSRPVPDSATISGFLQINDIEKHETKDGKAFYVMKIVIENDNDLKRFNEITTTLTNLDQLAAFDMPASIGDTGLIAFHATPGIPIKEYLAQHEKIDNPIEIALALLVKVKEVLDLGYSSRKFDIQCVYIDDTAEGTQVYLSQLWVAKLIEQSNLADDMENLSGLIANLFSQDQSQLPLFLSKKDKENIYWQCTTNAEFSERITSALAALHYESDLDFNQMMSMMKLAQFAQDHESFDLLNGTEQELQGYLNVAKMHPAWDHFAEAIQTAAIRHAQAREAATAVTSMVRLSTTAPTPDEDRKFHFFANVSQRHGQGR